MSNRLEFEATMDAAGFRAGVIELEGLSQAAAVRINAAFQRASIAAGLQNRARSEAAELQKYSRGMRGAQEAAMDIGILGASSTIFNATEQKTEAENYAAFWTNSMREIEEQQLATARRIAVSGGLASAIFGSHGFGGSHGGGISGIFRESFTILRELGRGNLTRVPGSVTLLAQYLGVLNVLVKSSAANAIIAAASENKLLSTLAQLAVVREVQYKQALKAAEADGLSAEAAMEATAAYRAQMEQALATAEAQRVKTAAAIENAEMENSVSKVTLTPLFYAGAALIALGTAAFFVWRHFKNLAASAAELRGMYDLSPTFREQSDAMLKAADMAEKYRDKIDEVSRAHDTLGKKLEAENELLKERQNLERELAQARGATAAQMAQLEIAQAEDEKKLAEAHEKQLKDKVAADKPAADVAEKVAEDFEKTGRIEAAERAFKNASDVRDALETAMQSNPAMQDLINQLTEARKSGGTGSSIAGRGDVLSPMGQLRYSQATGGTPFDVGGKPLVPPDQVGKVTLDQAIANLKTILGTQATEITVGGNKLTTTFNDASAEYDRLLKGEGSVADLKAAQKHLTKLSDDAAHDLDVDQTDLKKTQDSIAQLKASLGLKKQFLPQIADAQQNNKLPGLHGGSDSLVRVGNFLGASRGQMESLSAESNRIAREHTGLLRDIKNNTRPKHVAPGVAPGTAHYPTS